jgi:hypothetical protein
MARVITTILLDDNPKGLRLIEIANWAGKAFVVPRSKLKELRSREDAKQPGLYILLGEGEERASAYIGQSENVVERLLSHDSVRKDDEWNTAIVFVGQLDSTFIKYLESISLELAKKADRFDIFNSASPRENSLNEAQRIVANEYYERVKLITSLLGYSLFEVVSEAVVGNDAYYLKADGADARAQLLEDGSLNVLVGSLARIRETESFAGWSRAARQKFIEDGTFEDAGDGVSYRFTKDTVFSSPSAAAATVTGRPINGWDAWKDQVGKTLSQNVRD